MVSSTVTWTEFWPAIGWILSALGLAAAVWFVVALVRGINARRQWPIGIAMLALAGLVGWLLVGLWPIRVSDLPEEASVTCASGPVSDTGAAQGKGQTGQTTARVVQTVQTQNPLPSATAGPNPRNDAITAAADAQRKDPWLRCARVFGWKILLPFEIRLMLIVALAAAMGSFVHVATSFSGFIGAGKYDPNWLWFYILRVPIGISLAEVFYFAVRGGVLTSTSTSSSDINPYGVAALAGLVGLFSKQAANKLAETFNTMFKTAADAGEAPGGTDASSAPAIAGVTPASPSKAARGDKMLTVAGSNFDEDVTATVNGTPRTVERTAATSLTIQLEDADYDQRSLAIVITNPSSKKEVTTSVDIAQ